MRVTIPSLLLLLVPAQTAFPCHLPNDVREFHMSLTEKQMTALAMHGTPELISYSLAQAETCDNGTADIFACNNIDLLSVLQLNQIGGGTGNDLWGWTDPATGTEYALVGRSSGTSFIDLSDPENPLYIGNLPTHSASSTWRDIKVYQDHAFIVADFAGDHGIQIFDLNQLRDVLTPPVTFSETAHYDGFERAHNIVINEDTGFAYAVGSEVCSGGLHMVDIGVPTTPIFAGCYDGDGYTHDAQCVVYNGPDTDHQGDEVCFASNEDTVTIVDVTSKASPQLLSRTGYSGAGYTHQGWLTEDQQYFIHDDELDELFFGHNTRTYVWDVTDLDNPTLAGSYTADGDAIDHNQYIKGNHTYQANYRRGVRILNIDDPNTASLSEVAYFDTYPEGDGDAFDGAWSTYPFFDSGILLVSDINRGLFILRPNLGDDPPPAGDELTVTGDCPGTVTISVSGQTPNSNVTVLRSNAEGSTELTQGPCAGTVTGLTNPRRLSSLVSDGNGDASIDRQLPPQGCGLKVQALDVATCSVTNVSGVQ